MYKLFLCLRYLRKKRIAFFAVLAVSLCVAMVLIVVSVMGGFLQMVKDRSRGMLGDLIMENGSLQGFPFYEEFIEVLKTNPEFKDQVQEATPVIISYGVLRFPRDMITKPVQIVGIRLEETYRVNEYRKGLFYEKYYPGTTQFGKQKEPRVGFGPDREPAIPAELEAAWEHWKSTVSPREIAAVPISKRLGYQRPGYYRPLADNEMAESLAPRWIGPEYEGIILGTDLCAERDDTGDYTRFYWRGETVQLTMVPITDTGKLQTATGAPSKVFRYVDDSRTGIFDIDSTSVYVGFDMLQKVLEMTTQKLEDGGTLPPRATQIQIKLKPPPRPDAMYSHTMRDRITERWEAFMEPRLASIRTPELLSRVTVRTWEQKQERFIAAVEKEKILVTTLFGVISVVAVFLVGVIFYMIVQQNTRDIGIIKSVGATSLGVAGIFLSYGAAVGVVGGAMGTVLGMLFVRYINQIQDGLVVIGKKLGLDLQIWNKAVYSFDQIPDQVNMHDVAVIYIVAILASMVGALMAAVRAARIWPVEALRYE